MGRARQAAEARGRWAEWLAMAWLAAKGYRLLARLREAALLSERGDARSAVAIYDTVAADSGHAQISRDLAKLLSVSHGMSIMDRGEVEDRLTPLVGDDNPWRYSARELVSA